MPSRLHSLLPQIASLPLPKAGSRLDLPLSTPSCDSLALAQLASRGKPLLLVTAEPLDALRLQEELRWFSPKLNCHLLPDWETLPYDSFSPHQSLVSERLATLYAMSQGKTDVIVVPASTALLRLAPPAFLAAYTFFLKQGERLDSEQLRRQMALAGYAHVAQVVSPGEFSVRGGLIDLFPMGSALPLRVDLFDDEIESIRSFDPDTQRTVYPVAEIRLLPAREFPLDEAARARFRSRFRDCFEGDPSRVTLYKDISNGIASPGIEYYLPLFFEQTATLFDYLPADTVVILHRGVAAAIDNFWREACTRYGFLRGDRSHPVLPPPELFLDQEGFFQQLKAFPRVNLRHQADANEALTQTANTAEGTDFAPLPPLAVERRASDPLHALKAYLNSNCLPQGGRILVLADAPGRRETIAEFFNEYQLHPVVVSDFSSFLDSEEPFALGVAPLGQGMLLAQAKLAIITEAELYAATPRTRRHRDKRKTSSMETWLRDLSELRAGDPVVHISHGIGRYRGLVHMDMGEGQTEFLQLDYANDDKLYVPVSQLHVISRYSGADPDTIALHRLGSGQWDKAKRKAAQQVRDTAVELLALYAQRAARPGHRFDFSSHDLDAFAERFGFETTPDQQAAIDAVITDMKTARPMDRLVCGDVGFGKTEVALRAAFIAVADGRQVAVLTPTTLLAEQHYQTFSDRFADWPVRIAELSRFKSAREQAQTLEQVRDGRMDIVIGTHRLLQKDVHFKRLGLVIIDEEHCFGVRQKEALKHLRSEVDILTLTATPIPRTLGLALEGLREFSVIATPPQKRLAIKTFVQNYSKGLVREAVLREFQRGGQVFFLHNEVNTIKNMGDTLTALLPEARIVIGHGQLSERELERVMHEFTQQRANLLLCTTIIETGIDIASANTIVINRADRFGLAQLHQLRGRVGRSHHQAYAYLLTDQDAKPSPQAHKRLEAIAMMEGLGSGFYLSMHDLEIRGAGEVLGESQSGEIQQIGFSLYNDMLCQAVRDLQAGKEPDLSQPLKSISEINLHQPALLPNDYCPDVQERLTLYKRLANCDSEEALLQLREELVDRFGPLPEQAQTLIETHRMRLLVRLYGVQKLDAAETQIIIQFASDAPVDPHKVLTLIQQDPSTQMRGPDKLVRQLPPTVPRQRVQAVRELLASICLSDKHGLPSMA